MAISKIESKTIRISTKFSRESGNTLKLTSSKEYTITPTYYDDKGNVIQKQTETLTYRNGKPVPRLVLTEKPKKLLVLKKK